MRVEDQKQEYQLEGPNVCIVYLCVNEVLDMQWITAVLDWLARYVLKHEKLLTTDNKLSICSMFDKL